MTAAVDLDFVTRLLEVAVAERDDWCRRAHAAEERIEELEAHARREQLDTTGTVRWAHFEDNALSPHVPEDANYGDYGGR